MREIEARFVRKGITKTNLELKTTIMKSSRSKYHKILLLEMNFKKEASHLVLEILKPIIGLIIISEINKCLGIWIPITWSEEEVIEGEVPYLNNSGIPEIRMILTAERVKNQSKSRKHLTHKIFKQVMA